MKKLFVAVMAVAAISFASCGNKAQQAEAVADSTEVAAYDVEAAVSEVTNLLNEKIEAGDAGKLQQALEFVKAKAAEILQANPEAAQEYVAKVQSFLKENADKIKAVAGDNAAVAAAVAAFTEAPADAVVSGLSSAIQGAQDAGQEAVDAAKEAAEGAVDNAKQAVEDKANEIKDDAKQKANEAVDNAADKVKKGLGL